MNYCVRFKNWRRMHKHITQKEFARVLGVSLDTVKSVERGRRKVGYHVAQKFKELLERHAKAVPEGKVKWNG